LNKVKIFVLTNNPKFFYKINKELNDLGYKFNIIEFKDIIPNISSIILTTLEESKKIINFNKNKVLIFPYNEKEDFDKYIFNIIKIFQCGAKDYSNLLFSIDPGQTIGLAVFLDGFLFYSNSFYDKKKLISDIKKTIKNLSEDNLTQLIISFKFGRGVFSITVDLISEIYKIYNEKEKFKIYLINESKSSKIKLHKISDKLSKHEASAVILALRPGIEVNKDNYSKFIELTKSDKNIRKKVDEELTIISFLNQNIDLLKSVFLDIVDCKIPIDKVLEFIEQKKLMNNIPYSKN